ncbi:MAG TPA: TetR/AcrR family transcriptional regulator [Actinomycetota bacterium]|nr:TetR/AcrR family transcriptional regulator [Actinomycetota bacterium]
MTDVSDKPRDRILRAAVRLYSHEGIQAVGVNRIMAEADVAPTTLYRQFGGKDLLVAAAVERWGADWLDWLCERMDRGGNDLRARLDGLWDALAGWFASEGFRGSFVTNAAAELRGSPDHPAHEVIAEHRAAMRRVLGHLAELGGVGDPAALAARTGQLLVLVDGAIAIATVDRRPEVAAGANRLATALLTGRIDAGQAPAAAGAAFCRGRANGVTGSPAAARTAVLTPPHHRP